MYWLLLIAAEPGYVDPAACKPCHAEIYARYAKTGMGRSFSAAVKLPLATYTHEKSRRTYSVSGTAMNRSPISRSIDFVIGSGNHSQTFVHQSPSGKWLELPLSWYAEGGGKWRMSPGYDRPDHSEFTREVSDSCLFCHKAYDRPAAIDCQRCHGPGEAHIQRRGAIVNPAKLSTERSLDICLQCHLESSSRTLPDSILKLGRGINSFRPGEALEDYRVYFDFVKSETEDRITVNGAGYGMLQSPCYLKSGGKLQCSTCHDPHGEFTEQKDRFNAACRNCHGQKHEAARADCRGCHMQKRRTEDAVHVVMTDHRIRRPPVPGDPFAMIPEVHGRLAGPVKPLYPRRLSESRLYEAMAEGNSAVMEAALRELKSTDPRAYFELGEAWKRQGHRDQALAAYQKSADPRAVVAASEILLQNGRLDEAARSLESALRQWPKETKLWNSRAVVSMARGEAAESLKYARHALELDSEDELSWWNLGVCLEANGDAKGAEAAYQKSAELRSPGLRRSR